MAAQPHFPFGSIALGHGVGLRLHPVIRLLWPASERPGECPFLDPRASLVATYRNTLEPPMNAASYNAALHRNPLVSLLAELHDAAQHEGRTRPPSRRKALGRGFGPVLHVLSTAGRNVYCETQC